MQNSLNEKSVDGNRGTQRVNILYYYVEYYVADRCFLLEYFVRVSHNEMSKRRLVRFDQIKNFAYLESAVETVSIILTCYRKCAAQNSNEQNE